MRLSNLHSVSDNAHIDIAIDGDTITSIASPGSEYGIQQDAIHFENAIVFPGLINSHDHLDFNLYPMLGRGHYSNYVVWGTDIHNVYKDVINRVLAIPKELRTQWGIYKNLLNGVTTVVNHGEQVNTNDAPIAVYQDCNVLHSVRFEQNWKYKLNKPFVKRAPFVMHMGEGRDISSWEEINAIVKWNVLKRPMIGVHGIAMDTVQARSFKALVWCPYSNYFLVGKTADIGRLKHNTEILFGTDSTISAGWDLWEHLRIARKENALTDAELFNSLTRAPAGIWKLPKLGQLSVGFHADIVVARQKTTGNVLSSFFDLAPEDILMVMKKGQVVLFDDSLLPQLTDMGINTASFGCVSIGDSVKRVAGNIASLADKIRSYYHDITFPVNIASNARS